MNTDVMTDGRMSASIQGYIDLHEARVSVGVTESRASAAQAEAVTEQLVLVALVFGVDLPASPAIRFYVHFVSCKGILNRLGKEILGPPFRSKLLRSYGS